MSDKNYYNSQYSLTNRLQSFELSESKTKTMNNTFYPRFHYVHKTQSARFPKNELLNFRILPKKQKSQSQPINITNKASFITNPRNNWDGHGLEQISTIVPVTNSMKPNLFEPLYCNRFKQISLIYRLIWAIPC